MQDLGYSFAQVARRESESWPSALSSLIATRSEYYDLRVVQPSTVAGHSTYIIEVAPQPTADLVASYKNLTRTENKPQTEASAKFADSTT